MRARGLGVRRGDRTVLDGVEVDVPPGSVLAVTGASGAGKTTLLSALAGVLPPSAGSVDASPDVGICLQGVGLVGVLTAAENVELLLQARGVGRAEVRARAARALERVGLGELGDRLVDELSGGQQQRVTVARALVVEAPLVVADEPTSELDSASRDLVVAALREEAARGAAVVLATHDPDVAAACDAELHLVDGRVHPRP